MSYFALLTFCRLLGVCAKRREAKQEAKRKELEEKKRKKEKARRGMAAQEEVKKKAGDRKRKQVFIYGNYKNYYGYRVTSPSPLSFFLGSKPILFQLFIYLSFVSPQIDRASCALVFPDCFPPHTSEKNTNEISRCIEKPSVI